MRIDIEATNFTLTQELESYVERRVSFAFGRLGDSVSRVNVRLADVEGANGGTDRRCLVLVEIPGQDDVIAENTEMDLYVSIYRALDRVGFTVARRLQRQQEISRWRFRAGTSAETAVTRADAG